MKIKRIIKWLKEEEEVKNYDMILILIAIILLGIHSLSLAYKLI